MRRFGDKIFSPLYSSALPLDLHSPSHSRSPAEDFHQPTNRRPSLRSAQAAHFISALFLAGRNSPAPPLHFVIFDWNRQALNFWASSFSDPLEYCSQVCTFILCMTCYSRNFYRVFLLFASHILFKGHWLR
ncbi:uncharacterized protein LOC131329336 [Rhododendron vialii]|uniref:uncharacterized protein LOC131329336 n=1 Tax=Rhododendron vialii TaxID=182163 RepID=UPI00265F4AEA|nr:uncharacterized protein LOC131329336 [Rhododendron vialii]